MVKAKASIKASEKNAVKKLNLSWLIRKNQHNSFVKLERGHLDYYHCTVVSLGNSSVSLALLSTGGNQLNLALSEEGSRGRCFPLPIALLP